MSPKISVIIPIYNVEKHLEKCLLSVRNQTLEDIEIICVDDCSPDKSSSIVKRHAKEDSRITLISHKRNLGLGGARNTAIRVAKADYIASVDSDDYIVPEMLQTLWDASDDGQFDIVCCGFNRVDELGNIISYETYPSKIIKNDNNSINIFSTLNLAFWNKLWRKSLFTENEIFFPLKDYFEDLPTTPRILSKTKNIKIINDRLYHYYVREGSITNSYGPKHMIDYFKGFEILLRFLEENNLIERYNDEFINFVNAGLRFHSESVVGSGMNKTELEQYFRLLLMLKIAFFDNRDLFKYKNLGELLNLIKQKKVPGFYEINNDQLINEITKYKEALNKLEVEKIKASEEILNSQNKVVIKVQENNRLLEEVSKNKLLLEASKKDYTERVDEVTKYKLLFEASKKEHIERVDEVLKYQNQIVIKAQKNNELNEKVLKFKKLLDTSNQKCSDLEKKVSDYKNTLEAQELEKQQALTLLQKIGVSIYVVLSRLFLTKRQSLKLKTNSRLFFKDSKSEVSRVIGRILRLL